MGHPESASEFIGHLEWADIPEGARRRTEALVHDFAAVTRAGTRVPTSRLAADYAVQQHSGDQARLIYDRRRASATGAAFANGVLANALDFDDGHRLVKGHPGAVVIPATLAVAEGIGAPREEVLAAVTVGYEVAVRAGIALHARDAGYHGSGAWGAIGFTATNSVVLAGLGDASAGLGERWYVEDVYVKAFPCCRWSQPAIAAALSLRESCEVVPERVARVTVRTFGDSGAVPAASDNDRGGAVQHRLAGGVRARVR